MYIINPCTNRIISNIFSICYVCRNDIEQSSECVSCGISTMDLFLLSNCMTIVIINHRI